MSELNQISDLISKSVEDTRTTLGAEQPEQPEPVEDEVATEDSAEPVTAEEEVAEPVETEESSEDDEGTPVGSITELAEQLEVDPAELYGLKVPMPGGNESKTIGEIKDEYNSFLQEKKRFEKAREQYEQRAVEPAFLGEVPKELQEELQSVQNDIFEIERTYQSIDWSEYEKEDPANAVLQKTRFNEAYQNAQAKLQTVNSKIEGAKQESIQQRVAAERERTLELIPEWKDESVAKNDVEQIIGTMREYGFSPQEVTGILDSRVIKVVHDFAKIKSGLSKAKTTAKKPQNARRLKSGGLALQRTAKDKQRQLMFEKAAKSKDARDKTEAISHLIRGI